MLSLSIINHKFRKNWTWWSWFWAFFGVWFKEVNLSWVMYDIWFTLANNVIGLKGMQYISKMDLPVLNQLSICRYIITTDCCKIGAEGLKQVLKSYFPNLTTLKICTHLHNHREQQNKIDCVRRIQSSLLLQNEKNLINRYW